MYVLNIESVTETVTIFGVKNISGLEQVTLNTENVVW